MSSILKALQKLEHERAARRGAPPDISGEILKKQGKGGQPAPRWLLPAAMAVVAVLAVLATYAIMGGFSAKKPGVAPAATSLAASRAIPSKPSPAEPVPPGSTGAAARAPSLPPVEVVRDVPVARGAITRQAPHTPKPAPRQASLTPKPTSRPATPAPSSQQTAAAPVKADTPPPAPAKPSRPSLNVGGIAWQQDGALRLAVVNGMSVSEGSIVEGARIEEIFPDRIRFSYRNEHFELPVER